MKNKKQGFTLVELLVVIAIIGILATLAVVALQSSRRNARDAKRIADISQIQTALELYFNDNQAYPLTGEMGSTIATGGITYMATVPSTPTPNDGDCTESDNEYTYVSTDGSTYTITFCTGLRVGGLSEGMKIASPSGIIDLRCGDAGYLILDINDNIYNTVKIGDQCWMKENLKTTKYNNGINIPTGLNNTDWENDTAGAYTVYPHGSVSGCSDEACVLDMYGGLYNWHAVNTGNLCPTGWSVPTDAQFTILTNYLSANSQYHCGGNSNNIGKSLANTSGWTASATDCHIGNDQSSNNTTGFTAFSAGTRGSNGLFYIFGDGTALWSSSEDNPGNPFFRRLRYDNIEVFRHYTVQAFGFSVRCLKN